VLPVIVAVAGLATYFAVAKVLFSASVGSIASWLCRASVPLLLAAIATRASTAPLEALVFTSSAASVKKPLRFPLSYRGICASLAMEYVLPFGGLTEVYKVFFYTRCGFSLNEAVAAMFVHRLALSLSLLVMAFVVSSSVELEAWLRLAVLATSIALAASNVAGIAIAYFRRSGAALGTWAEKIVSRLVPKSIASYVDSSQVFEFRQIDVRLGWVAAAFAVACVEHLAIALAGYLTALSLGIDLGFVKALLVFDVIQSILWLLPAVTPGSIGVLETVQLATLKAIGMSGAAAAIPLLYRIVILCSMLPQLMPMLVTDVMSFVKSMESRATRGTQVA